LRIQWTKRASENLDAIEQYIEKDNPIAAAKTALRILTAISLLQEHPELGRPGRVYGTRELVIPQSYYIVPYAIKGDKIQILRVFHTAMQWPKQF
jgi:addiction module RelE/StbE family toxin